LKNKVTMKNTDQRLVSASSESEQGGPFEEATHRALCDEPVEETVVTLEGACALVRERYSADLELAYRAALGVAGSLSLSDRDNCVVLVFEGGASAGKSTICRMLMPLTEKVGKVVERVDTFTCKAFVSNAANRTKKQLDEIDLLPRLCDKVMLTKELSPLFSADEKSLTETFGTLTSILDGNGHKTNSGSHGARGYAGKYMFNWIGATTPIPARTHNLMSQLGNRILFYELAPVEMSDEELLAFAEENGTKTPIEECNRVTNRLLENHFARHPVSSVKSNEVKFPREFIVELIRYAKLTVNGRLQSEKDPISGVFEAGTKEVPMRAILLLKVVSLGLALMANRMVVTSDDLDVIRRMAFSSIPFSRRNALRALIGAGGEVSSTALESILGYSKPTVLARMKDLARTEIASYQEGNAEESRPAVLTLSNRWRWLLEAFPAFTPTP
jgi:hypothetical protein